MAIIDTTEVENLNEQPQGDSEFPRPLSERDSVALIEMLENPPPPNAALRQAVARYKKMAVRR